MRPSQNDPIKLKVEEAIRKLLRSKKKMTISGIAAKAEIERKTIYNRPELLEMCNEAIAIHQNKNSAAEEVAVSEEIVRETVTDQVKRIKSQLNEQKDANRKILENNRQLILEKQELLNKLEIMRKQLENNQKLVPFKTE